ncbi:MAG: adenylate/guanylate cyclase domain-containing protein [Actinomycetia bacterium]|nr:adenylate/guanylate cyclase domain-containing protein [Actinomycetes bacterium]
MAPDSADGSRRESDISWEEMLLGHPPRMTKEQIAEESGAPNELTDRLWHALGFPLVEDDEALFTDADLAALRRVQALLGAGVAEETALSMTRALARTTDRLAVWQTQLLAELYTPHELTDASPTAEDLSEGVDPAAAVKDTRTVANRAIAEAAARELVRISGDLEPLLIFAWRRHLTAAVTRMLADATPDIPSSAPSRIVGFADLVSFTSLVRRMSERQLGRVVQRFEVLASDVVTAHGGRVIKTVGDEVLFVHTDPAAAAAIALDLVEAMSDDPLLPAVRVGMAYGRVVSRLGDVFGLTVNRASRLTAVTPDGRVHVDEPLAALLRSVSGFEVTPARRRILRGIGPVRPGELRRHSSERRFNAP